MVTSAKITAWMPRQAWQNEIEMIPSKPDASHPELVEG